MKRLAIDTNCLVPLVQGKNLFGISRSTQELILALEKIKNIPFEIVLYTQNLKGIKTNNFRFKNIHLLLPNRAIINKILSFLPVKKLITRYDLIHIPHNTDYSYSLKNTIFTIHDLIVYRYPEMWNFTKNERNFHAKLAKQCKAIITCSEASRNDIIKFWNIPKEKIHVIPWGVNLDVFYKEIDEKFLGIYGLDFEEFIFCASCNHQRKNLPLLLSAFKNYHRQGGFCKLVLLNPLPDAIKTYSDLVDAGFIIIFNKIDDRTLRLLYSQARISILISLYEGFGLPILESLACGTNVICAKNSSLIEAGGSIVHYLSELSLEALTEKLVNLDYTKKNCDEQSVMMHLEKFSWNNCAKKYIQVYTKLLNS